MDGLAREAGREFTHLQADTSATSPRPSNQGIAMTEAEITAILESLIKDADKPGREPGVFTTQEFQAQSSWSKHRAITALLSMSKQGRVAPDMVRITNAWGQSQRVKGWRILEHTKK